MSWLPEGFRHPTLVEVGEGHHLRPVRASDAGRDPDGVLGLAGPVGPPSFVYALLDDAETEVLGACVVAPAGTPASTGMEDAAGEIPDAAVTWWVADGAVGTPLDRMLRAAVPVWIGQVWPFERPRLTPLR